MSRIHPTAIVEPGAQLDESVEVGPYAIVGAHVVIGARTTIGSHSVIEGHTTIGEDNRICHYASVGGRPQDKKYEDEPTRLEIGDRNTIREFTTIHSGTVQDAGVTTIGDDNWIMAYVHVGHDCRLGSNAIMSSNAQLAGHVTVGDYAIVGGMSRRAPVLQDRRAFDASAARRRSCRTCRRSSSRPATRPSRTASTSRACSAARLFRASDNGVRAAYRSSTERPDAGRGEDQAGGKESAAGEADRTSARCRLPRQHEPWHRPLTAA